MEGVLLFTLQRENVALILLFHPIPQMDRVPHVTPPVCYKETKQTLNKKN
jgi:hypothetical protein